MDQELACESKEFDSNGFVRGLCADDLRGHTLWILPDPNVLCGYYVSATKDGVSKRLSETRWGRHMADMMGEELGNWAHALRRSAREKTGTDKGTCDAHKLHSHSAIGPQ